jgi:hypothetical protein
MNSERYYLQNDPHELRNLIGFESHQPVADVMRDRLIKWLQRADEDIPKIITAPSRPSGQRTVTEHELQQ